MNPIFEDVSVIVCIKPVGLLSQGEGENCLITKLKEHTGGEIYPIHRLDRGVGGVMVYAKTKAAAAALSRQVAEHKIEKEYLALVHGVPKEKSGTLEDLLFKDSRKNKVFVVTRERRGVKKAVCRFESVLCGKTPAGEEYTLVRVSLQTGRTHQIRVSLHQEGCRFSATESTARVTEKRRLRCFPAQSALRTQKRVKGFALSLVKHEYTFEKYSFKGRF